MYFESKIRTKYSYDLKHLKKNLKFFFNQDLQLFSLCSSFICMLLIGTIGGKFIEIRNNLRKFLCNFKNIV